VDDIHIDVTYMYVWDRLRPQLSLDRNIILLLWPPQEQIIEGQTEISKSKPTHFFGELHLAGGSKTLSY